MLCFLEFEDVLFTKINDGFEDLVFLFFEKHDDKIKDFVEEIFIEFKVFFDDNLSKNVNGGNFDLSSIAGESGANDFDEVFHQSHFVEKLEKLLKDVGGLFSGSFIGLFECDHNLGKVGFDEIENVLNVSFVFIVTFESLPELFQNGNSVVFGGGENFVVVLNDFDDLLGETLGHVVDGLEDEFVAFFLEDVFFCNEMFN